MQPTMNVSQWLTLPHPIRLELVKLFNLSRSAGTQVIDNRVISDGYTFEDLQAINVETMQAVLNSQETDFYVLLNAVADLANDLTVPIQAPVPGQVSISVADGIQTLKSVQEALEKEPDVIRETPEFPDARVQPREPEHTVEIPADPVTPPVETNEVTPEVAEVVLEPLQVNEENNANKENAEVTESKQVKGGAVKRASRSKGSKPKKDAS